MFQQQDQRLSTWIASVLSEAGEEGGAISLELPPSSAADRSQQESGVSLYLLDLIESPPLRTQERPPLQVVLRYLVTVWAQSPSRAHALLGHLLFAALEDAELTVDLQPLSAQMWLALGVRPRPGFVLRVPVRKERPLPQAPLVRRPLGVRTAAVQALWGVLLGPEEEPMAGARITLPSLGISTHTDARGRFRIGLVPGATTVYLRISARGHEQEVSIEEPTSSSEPVIIYFHGL